MTAARRRAARVPEGIDRGRLLTGLLLVLPIPLCWLIFTMETPPITRWGYIGIEGFTYRTDYNHALMGIVAVAGLSLMARTAWKPSMPGIM